MTTWRPRDHIQVKALGLHWRDGRVLAAEVLADDGSVKGMRPLGGTVDFGETAEAAVIREFQEELGITVRPLGPPWFMENLYVHEGHQGHEILAIFEVAFPAGAYDGASRITFEESDGVMCHAEWVDPAGLDRPGRPGLFPQGLLLRRP